MEKTEGEARHCRYCDSAISAKASVCPTCLRGQSVGRARLRVFFGGVVPVVLLAASIYLVVQARLEIDRAAKSVEVVAQAKHLASTAQASAMAAAARADEALGRTGTALTEAKVARAEALGGVAETHKALAEAKKAMADAQSATAETAKAMANANSLEARINLLASATTESLGMAESAKEASSAAVARAREVGDTFSTIKCELLAARISAADSRVDNVRVLQVAYELQKDLEETPAVRERLEGLLGMLDGQLEVLKKQAKDLRSTGQFSVDNTTCQVPVHVELPF